MMRIDNPESQDSFETVIRWPGSAIRHMRRWKFRRSNGRHAPRFGRKPRPAGAIWTHPYPDYPGYMTGPGCYVTRRARRTVGIRKPKRRQWVRPKAWRPYA